MVYNIYINQIKLNNNTVKALDEYKKRLTPYCTVNLFLAKNTDISSVLKNTNYKILVDKKGDTISSEDLARYISDITVHGASTVDIFINHDIPIYNYKLTISHMNISNDLLSNILYEQLYRAYMINIGKTYHK